MKNSHVILVMKSGMSLFPIQLAPSRVVVTAIRIGRTVGGSDSDSSTIDAFNFVVDHWHEMLNELKQHPIHC